MTEYKWPLMKDTITMSDRLAMSKFILTASRFTQGDKVREFEHEWSKWLGAPASLFVTSGSTANFLLVAAVMEKYGIKRGDKVLLPACTWVTNVNPIIQLGLEPIFCDINLENYSFCFDALDKVEKVHPDIKLIFVTHLLGIPANNYDNLQVRWPKAVIIDDVCESHGCKDYRGNKIGSRSIGATFSFYYGHHMSTIEGGMISTNDYDLHEIMTMKRSHGMARLSQNFQQYAEANQHIDKSFLFMTDGYNFRNTEINAVLGLQQLKRLDKFIENRRTMYGQFVTISNITGLFHPIYHHLGNSSFCFPFICKHKDTKDALVKIFDKHKIEHRPVVSGNLMWQPYLKGKYQFFTAHDNVATLHNNGVYIGNNQYVTRKDMLWLEQVIGELYGK
jgi:CDP-6-deoxy-D-xylo-4-hexulose-3-dehydrase